MIDTHCHLNFQAFATDLPDVVRRAKQNGVEQFIVPGTDLISSKKAIDLSLAYPDAIFASIGIHPHHAQDPNFYPNDTLKIQLSEMISKNRKQVVAIGEIGLDFFVYQKTKYENREVSPEIIAKQIALLNMQLSIAHDFDLPVILHCRKAFPQMIKIIKLYHDKYQTISAYASHFAKASLVKENNSRRSSASDVKTNYIKPYQVHGVWHCFTGSTQDLKALITMGYYIGFDGNITYSPDYSTLVDSTPLNRILLETDAPYLSPIPMRGKRNTPSNILIIAETVAKYHHTPLSQVIHISTSNAQKLFKI